MLIKFLFKDIIINQYKIYIILLHNFIKYLNIFNKELLNTLNNNGSFNITFDIWTARNQISYMGVNLSFINNDFKLISKLIGFKPINNYHTGLNIFEIFKLILELYSILIENIFR